MKTKDLKTLLDICYVAKRVTETFPELPKGIKPRHIHVLDAVNELQNAEDGCRVSDVSNHLKITMPSVTTLVQELTEKNLLEKYYQKEDKRVTLLRLTKKGDEIAERYITEFHGNWAANMKDVTEEQVQQTVELLTKLKNTMPGIKAEIKNESFD